MIMIDSIYKFFTREYFFHSYFINNFLCYEIIPSMLMSILCCISIYILYRNSISMKSIRKCFFLSFIIGMLVFTGSYLIIFPILFIIDIVQLKYIENDLNLKMLINIYSIYLANTIYIRMYIFFNVKLKNIPIAYTLIEFIIMLIIIVLLCLIIYKINSRKKVNKEMSPSQVRFRMILIISILLAIVMWLSLADSDSIGVDKANFILGNFVPEAIPLISNIIICIMIYYYDISIQYRLKLKREVEEKKEIEEYSRIIESMYGETRKFKHDYINMLSPLKEYIDNGDMDTLRNFFYTNIVDMDKDIKWNNSNIDKLKYINISGLKGLLSTKFIKALSMNMDIKIDIIENINNISMNVIDLCRIMGILIDNAIEAAKECEYPKMSICIVNKNDYVVIALENNFFGDKPLIHKIYQEGFSTKGSGRGLGLYNVRNIIDEKYDNVFLNTSIEKMFIQELWIKNT